MCKNEKENEDCVYKNKSVIEENNEIFDAKMLNM